MYPLILCLKLTFEQINYSSYKPDQQTIIFTSQAPESVGKPINCTKMLAPETLYSTKQSLVNQSFGEKKYNKNSEQIIYERHNYVA